MKTYYAHNISGPSRAPKCCGPTIRSRNQPRCSTQGNGKWHEPWLGCVCRYQWPAGHAYTALMG
eukprot:CAMPEP_0204466126 /NCGR_PEP_ID=MMETSP0471-20130131/8870_1 /ASSEMBLY_ACC=CAM_ASM_000602 /TAXON_ID=2969 /ORGANISM="Oxyrrhis marina" /LENGTH=63 /DNA_ID=CAMNT_0051467715 /DNA_START=87 /DNA_END=275 /DNA_ORIENTATION=-